MITLPAKIELQASGDKPATITILAYGGGVMRPGGWSDLVIDLSGLELSDSVPLLGDHNNNLDSVLGSGSPSVANGQLHIHGQLARGTAAADRVIALSRSGVKLAASVGVNPGKLIRLSAGESVTVNGKSFTASGDGLTIVKAGELKEVSVVPIGADRSAGVLNIAASKGKTMSDPKFNEWVSQIHADSSNLTASQLAGLHANYNGRSEATADDHTAVAGMIQASGGDPVADEARRLRQIEAACKGDFGPDQQDEVHDLKAAAINCEISVDSLIERMRPIRATSIERKTPMAHTVRSGRRDQMSRQSIEASLLIRSGKQSLAEKSYDEQTLDAAYRQRHTSLVDIAASCAVLDGRDIQGMDRGSIIKAAFSTISLPTALGNTMGKTLFDAYQQGTQNWRGFCRVMPAADFKAQTGIRPSFGGSFEQVGAAGEVPHGTLKEATFPWRIGTYAKQLAVTRQDLINDDLGFLNEAAPLMGKMAARSLNDLIWQTIMSNSGSFFSSGNANLLEAASALGTTSLASAVSKMRRQTDADGNSIDIAPAVLAVPPELEFTARALLESTDITAAIASGDSDSTPTGNALKGLAALVVEPRLSNSNFTNYDLDAWYLFASPMDAPVIVGFLDGIQAPTIEFFGMDRDINTLGIAWRVYHDFGVALADYRAAVMATGAAS